MLSATSGASASVYASSIGMSSTDERKSKRKAREVPAMPSARLSIQRSIRLTRSKHWSTSRKLDGQ